MKLLSCGGNERQRNVHLSLVSAAAAASFQEKIFLFYSQKAFPVQKQKHTLPQRPHVEFLFSTTGYEAPLLRPM